MRLEGGLRELAVDFRPVAAIHAVVELAVIGLAKQCPNERRIFDRTVGQIPPAAPRK